MSCRARRRIIAGIDAAIEGLRARSGDENQQLA
jgi:hypothetical protein